MFSSFTFLSPEREVELSPAAYSSLSRDRHKIHSYVPKPVQLLRMTDSFSLSSCSETGNVSVPRVLGPTVSYLLLQLAYSCVAYSGVLPPFWLLGWLIHVLPVSPALASFPVLHSKLFQRTKVVGRLLKHFSSDCNNMPNQEQVRNFLWLDYNTNHLPPPPSSCLPSIPLYQSWPGFVT